MKNEKNLLMAAGLVLFLFFSSGCAIFLLGAGAAGGIAISDDTMEGNFDKNFDRVWKITREVIMHDGFIRLEDKPHGKLEAEIKKSQVEVELSQLTPQTVRLRIKARKGYKLLPDMDLANSLHNRISSKL